MNTQDFNPAFQVDASQTTCSATQSESRQDTFSLSLVLWLVSFPLFVAGLMLLGGSYHTIGYLLELAAVICFLSPVTQLLGCLFDRK